VDPLDFLASLERLGIKFGLETMTTLCAALGNPERCFRSVVVAGTNGKGSVTAMTSAALHAAGHRAARYTSPHLQRVEERFVIGEKEVETEALRAAAATVHKTIERLVREGPLAALPTYFECATAIAFELFRLAGVNVAVLEVGLGGRLDATNVVMPVAVAITSLDFDHRAQLGDTIESIAREKAGVIKPGIPVVCGPLPVAADRVVATTCLERGARLIRAVDRVTVRARIVDGDTLVDVRSARHDLADLTLALAGRHQAQNAAVAVCLLEELTEAGIPVGSDAVAAALTQVEWPARLEHFQWHGADVLLDAAHNAAGTRALAAYLSDIGWTDITLLFGVMRDKDVREMLPPLLSRTGRLICTTPPSARARSAEDVASIAGAMTGAPAQIDAIADPAGALASACRRESRVVVAGSIFLAGPLRDILR
jgi:dihydrofolate synthase/folylpolyglutamate synthase